MLFRPSRPKAPEPPKLGFRSSLVLAKLGYDLRERYQDVLEEALPEAIERPLGRLEGADEVTQPGEVTQLMDRKPR